MEAFADNQKNLVTRAKTTVRALFRRLEVERAVFFGILAKIWNVGTGPVTAILIATQFSPELQGYYYTFGTLLALQVFVELGLGIVVQQFASHEWARLSLDETGGITGDEQARSRLISIAKVAFRWYAVGGIVAAVGLSVGGFFFFGSAQTSNVNWLLPWFTLCCLTGINISFTSVSSLLEGCNQVGKTYPFQFLQGTLRTLSLWVAMIAGAGLWTVPIASFVAIASALVFWMGRYFLFLKTLLFTRPTGQIVSWSADMLPMQWRIALTWICDYFIYSLFTPVLFKYHGAAAAGQMGMTWTAVGFVGSISSMWIYPRVPKFAILIAQRKFQELDALFWRITGIVISVSVIIAVSIWCLVYILYATDFSYSVRLLSPLPTGLFLCAHVLFAVSLPFAYYMRAHRKEPMMPISVLGAVMIASSTLLLGKRFSATGMAFGYLLVQMIIVPLVILIWHRCRIRWHSDAPSL